MSQLSFTQSFIDALRAVATQAELLDLMAAASQDMGFRYYALVHHDDLRQERPDRIDLKRYPTEAINRLVWHQMYRRDPIIRGCLFADSAFLWSELGKIISLDRRDRECFARGAREGLNEGITVPCIRLGECIGSCTFAGISDPARACRFLGVAQMIGIFAFQAARRIQMGEAAVVGPQPRLHPRPHDCVVLAGQGFSNKEIARLLGLTPRTIDGYLTEARRLFSVNDRTELVVKAVLSGEVGLHELRRQPE